MNATEQRIALELGALRMQVIMLEEAERTLRARVAELEEKLAKPAPEEK